MGEEELRGIDTKPLVGHLAAWNYFMTIDTPENKAFIDRVEGLREKENLPDGDKRVTNDPMEATYIGIRMWAQAVCRQVRLTSMPCARPSRTDRQGALGLHIDMDAQEPPPAQARVHRRSQAQRPVSGRVEDGGPHPRGLEPLHSREREEGRRLDLSLGLRQLHGGEGKSLL